ncbi:uncharacterized protein LOC113352680 [Papaver somniferum]|uniref:uncharacterized protein LOC113352680 n=1 Tax=Papaver somniferum TaxID=3469 RepID=UPI000E704C5A|nr:uncharacterized protein LOC113352680 [Papaver somniferum]
MTKSLSAKGKTGYIDVTVKKPTNPSDLPHWTRCDALVGSWISNFVDLEIRSSAMNFPSTHEQWLEIKSRFSPHNASKLYALKQSIAILKQENLSVAMYDTRLKSLWDQLDTFRPIEPFICNAGKNYVDHHNQDRSMSSCRVYMIAFLLCVIKYCSWNPCHHLPKFTIMFDKKKNNSDQRNPRVFPSNGTNKRQRPFCDHCNKHGHTRQTCWKINEYPKDLAKQRNLDSHTIVVVHQPAIHQPATAAPAISAAQICTASLPVGT